MEIIVDGPSGSGKSTVLQIVEGLGFQRQRGLVTFEANQQNDQSQEAAQMVKEAGLIGKNPITLFLKSDVATLTDVFPVLDSAAEAQRRHIAEVALHHDVVIDRSHISAQVIDTIISQLRNEPDVKSLMEKEKQIARENPIPANGVIYTYAAPEVLVERRGSDVKLSQAEVAAFPQVMGISLSPSEPYQRLATPDGVPVLAIDTGKIMPEQEAELIGLFIQSLQELSA